MSRLQGWMRATARSLQENVTGGSRLAKGRFIDGCSTSVVGGWTGKGGGAHRVGLAGEGHGVLAGRLRRVEAAQDAWQRRRRRTGVGLL
jgi:hypothetical protein